MSVAWIVPMMRSAYRIVFERVYDTDRKISSSAISAGGIADKANQVSRRCSS